MHFRVRTFYRTLNQEKYLSVFTDVHNKPFALLPKQYVCITPCHVEDLAFAQILPSKL
jgi:hypothetical protein